MKLRTRVAFMAILLLVGWVLASPYYRNNPVARTHATTTAPPLLQLQRPADERRQPPTSSPIPSRVVPLIGVSTTTNPGESVLRHPNERPDQPERDPGRSIHMIPSGPAPRPYSGARSPSPQPRRLQPAPDPIHGQSTDITVPPQAVGPSANQTGPIPKKMPPTPTGIVPGPMTRKGQTDLRLRPVTLLVNEVGAEFIPEPRNLQQSRATESEPMISEQPAASKQPPPRNRLQRHRIVNGDSLESIAAEYLNSGQRALEIYELNRDVLASPTILPLGTELYIPSQ